MQTTTQYETDDVKQEKIQQTSLLADTLPFTVQDVTMDFSDQQVDMEPDIDLTDKSSVSVDE